MELHLQSSGRVLVPGLVPETASAVEVVLYFPDGRVLTLDAPLRRSRTVRRRISVEDVYFRVPASLRRTLALPCRVPADLTFRTHPTETRIRSARAELSLSIQRRGAGNVLRIPSAWARGATDARIEVRVEDRRLRFTGEALRLVGGSTGELSLPADVPTGVDATVTIRGTQGRPILLCHQRRVRDLEASRSSEPMLERLGTAAYVVAVDRRIIRPLIVRYEWLHDLGKPQACYALFSGRQRTDVYNVDGQEILGAICFGHGPAPKAHRICEAIDVPALKPICLTRGTCVHWAPKNAASFLIRHATRRAYEEHGWNIFFAYADEAAGEIGTVYQAANWFYVGQDVAGLGRTTQERFRRPDGRVISGRVMRRDGMTKAEAIALGWSVVVTPRKHKYIWFEGGPGDKRQLRRRCRYPFLPYPKRAEELDESSET